MRTIPRAQALTMREQIGIRLSEPFGKRAVELAVQAHLDGTPKILAMRERTMIFAVPSRDRCRTHQVVADYAGSIWCDCMAAQFSRSCCHAGAVSLYLRQMAQACTAYAS